MPAVACRERPFAQADRVDHEHVAVPLRHRVTHECQFDVGRMRLSDRNDAKKVHVLIKNDHGIAGLHDLLRVRRKGLARMTVRQAERSGIVMEKVAGWFLEEFCLRTWKKRSHPAAIETGNAWCVGVIWAHDMKESRPGPHAGKLRLA